MKTIGIKKGAAGVLFGGFVTVVLALSAMAVERIPLDKDLKPLGSRVLPANEILILEAADVAEEIEAALVAVKVDSLSRPEFLRSVVTVEGRRVWSAEVGPFLPKSKVQISLRILRAISGPDKEAVRTALGGALDRTLLEAAANIAGVMEETDFVGLLKERLRTAVKEIEKTKDLRTKTGDSLASAVERLFEDKEFLKGLNAFFSNVQDIASIESALRDNLAELRGLAKEKNYGEEIKKIKNDNERRSVSDFWEKVVTNDWTSALLAAQNEKEIENALKFGETAIAKRCLSYAPALVEQPRAIREKKGKNGAFIQGILKEVSLILGNVSLAEIEILDFRIEEIDHWAGFNVGYFGCAGGLKNVLPAFLIDIHPCRFDLENESRTWNNERFWKRFSFSAGIGLSSPNRPDRADRWYLLGIGFRLNPFFRLHVADAIFFETAKDDQGTVQEKGWKHVFTVGLSLSIRELSHVLGFFGGVKSGQDE